MCSEVSYDQRYYETSRADEKQMYAYHYECVEQCPGRYETISRIQWKFSGQAFARCMKAGLNSCVAAPWKQIYEWNFLEVLDALKYASTVISQKFNE